MKMKLESAFYSSILQFKTHCTSKEINFITQSHVLKVKRISISHIYNEVFINILFSGIITMYHVLCPEGLCTQFVTLGKVSQ
uniref:T-complex protein 1 subunit gamma-like n=1 Tax=Rhizophora mucronata TaxID=61149 RepID=A0A2P2KV15_RHIMU